MDAAGWDAWEARVRKILSGLGFTDKMQKMVVSEFSGGWRMRISLWKALFLQPRLLLLDEPTNHLDLDAVIWLDNYLWEEYPHAVICVSHDADFLDAICTDIIHLDNKKLNYYRGGYSEFCKMLGQTKLQEQRKYKQMQDELKWMKRGGKTREKAEEEIKRKFDLESTDQIFEKPKDYIVKFNFYGLGQESSLGGLSVSDVSFIYNYEKMLHDEPGDKPYELLPDGTKKQIPWLLEGCDFGVDCKFVFRFFDCIL